MYILDYHLYMSGLGFYSGTEEHAETMAEFIMTILLLIDVLGGMIGKLLADWSKPIIDLNIGNVPFKFLVLGYFVVINAMTLILFPRMKRFAYVITPREKICMVLSFLGGATGGYLSMKVTGSHQNSSMLMNTLPEMIIKDAIVISCMFLVI